MKTKTKHWAPDGMKKCCKSGCGNVMPESEMKSVCDECDAGTFLIKIASALDTLTNGKGYGKKEDKICKLAEAAPDLLRACEAAVVMLSETEADYGSVTDYEGQLKRDILQLKAAITKAAQN